MNKQVLSISQMNHLQELGIDTSKASMCWLKMGEDTTLSVHNEYCYESSLMNPIPTFTLQDILEMLPHKIKDYFLFIQKDRYTFTGKDCYRIYYKQVWKDCRLKEVQNNNLLDAAYEMLCWCIEKGYRDKEE